MSVGALVVVLSVGALVVVLSVGALVVVLSAGVVEPGLVSALASPDPLTTAAPTPRVTAPAPNQVETSLWRWWVRRRAFLRSALARFVVRCLVAIAVPSIRVAKSCRDC